MMMGVATTLIGLLPTYESIGIAAPLMLVALRFIQGLAVGGQWGGAMLLVTESAPSNGAVGTVPMRRQVPRWV